MSISTQTQAVLLMTAWFTKSPKGDPKPLTTAEWGRFAQWLKENGKSPEGLLASDDLRQWLAGWSDRNITPDRIHYLLGRSGALSLALEKWQRAGLWVMTRSDFDYPSRLKRQLKYEAPPLLFGCGDRRLLDRGGIAVIGSREASGDDLAYTSQLGAEIAFQGFSVISGGARGVDEAAMLGALNKEGTVIGVLGDSLLRTAMSAKYRKSLMSKNLVLVSPFNPEAHFDVGNAMSRNKYIYCLADAAVVVTTGRGRGGTWNGAIENLKAKWVPLWVKPHPDQSSGNAALVTQGGQWIPSGDFVANSRLTQQESMHSQYLDAGLFHTPMVVSKDIEAIESVQQSECVIPEISGEIKDKIVPQVTQVHDSLELGRLTFYEFFLLRLEILTSVAPVTEKQLLESFDISQKQIKDWLKRAVAEGRATRFSKPIRYQSAATGQQTLKL